MSTLLWILLLIAVFSFAGFAVSRFGRWVDACCEYPEPKKSGEQWQIQPIYGKTILETDDGNGQEMKKAEEGRERILVCLSTSPSNRKVITAALKMAEAFGAALTAIYVKPAYYDDLPDTDRLRLQDNMRYAELKGASVTTIPGNDVPVRIAEFAALSGVTKVVIGRSGARRQHFWSKTPLTEQLLLQAPELDIYIIPDSAADLHRQTEKIRRTRLFRPTVKDSLLTLLFLAAATGTGLLFTLFGFSESNIITVFILGVLITSVVTVNPLYSAVSSLASVLLFNYFFIDPKFSFHTYETEYVVTFGIMLISSLITGTLANRLKENARQSAREAFRTKVLFDTNQLLQKAENTDDAIRIIADQTVTLLDRDVFVYVPEEDSPSVSVIRFRAPRTGGTTPRPDPEEKEIASWVFKNRVSAGTRLEHYGRAASQYYPIALNEHCYAVLGICLDGRPPEAFESSVLQSILGECAFALDGMRNAAEKERAAVMARNERLRSTLLRSVSHDIRTPLTSISGNASNLLSHYRQLDDETLRQIFSDIRNDSEWLIDLTENLLSLSRLENGQMGLNLSVEALDDVIEEALKHVDKDAEQHRISTLHDSSLPLVKADARLIMQVVINLVNNAVKNTPPGSAIEIETKCLEDTVTVSVRDDGPGIPDDRKPHVFEMFYTGKNTVADGRRGIGFGLALCKAVVEAHGGAITLTDNTPSGCCFTFSLPLEEVDIHE